MGARNIAGGEEAEPSRQAGGDLRPVRRLSKGTQDIRLMDCGGQRDGTNLGELRAQVADGRAPELGPAIRGSAFGTLNPVGVIAEQFAIVTRQADAEIPKHRTTVLLRHAGVILPRARIGGQQRIEFGSKTLKRIGREFLQPLIAQDRAEPRRQAPGAEQVGVHLHAQAAVADQAMREPVARPFTVDHDDILMERLAVRTCQHLGEALGQCRHVEALIKVQSGHRGSL